MNSLCNRFAHGFPPVFVSMTLPAVFGLLAVFTMQPEPVAAQVVACVVGPGVTQTDTTVTGSGGNDTIDCTNAGPGKTINGAGGDDTITGTMFNDFIDGGDGNDTITGGPGNDCIEGGNGNDTLTGSEGSNTVVDSGDGNDTISGNTDPNGAITGCTTGPTATTVPTAAATVPVTPVPPSTVPPTTSPTPGAGPTATAIPTAAATVPVTPVPPSTVAPESGPGPTASPGDDGADGGTGDGSDDATDGGSDDTTDNGSDAATGDATDDGVDNGMGVPTLFDIFVSPRDVPGGSSATGTVTLNGPAPEGGATVTLFSDNSAVTVPLSVVVPGGQTSVIFAITTLEVTTATGVAITATLDGISVQATLTVTALTAVGALPNTGAGESPAGISHVWAWAAMLGALLASLAGYGWGHRSWSVRSPETPRSRADR